MVWETRIVNEWSAKELAEILPRKFTTNGMPDFRCKIVRPMNSACLYRVQLDGYIPDGVYSWVDGYLAGRAVETHRVTTAI